MVGFAADSRLRAVRLMTAMGIVTVIRVGARDRADETGGMKSPPDPNYRHRFPATIISHAVWLYHVFSLSLRDVDYFWLSAASSSHTRRCGDGAINSERALPIVCAAVVPGRATSGISTRYLSRPRAFSITFGVPWISTVLSSISWSRERRDGKAKPEAVLQTSAEGPADMCRE